MTDPKQPAEVWCVGVYMREGPVLLVWESEAEAVLYVGECRATGGECGCPWRYVAAKAEAPPTDDAIMTDKQTRYARLEDELNRTRKRLNELLDHAEGRANLCVFDCGDDVVIAETPEEATRIMCEQLGENAADYGETPWRKLDPTDTISVRLEAAEWVRLVGRGFFVSRNI